MAVRPFRSEDAALVGRLPADSATSQADFVLNPMWESESEFRAEFERHGITPEEHLIVEEREGEILGISGYLRWPAHPGYGGLLCPVVARVERGRGVGGELIRASLDLGRKLGIQIATAGIGTRNRSGYSLLTAHGFRPVRQHFLMRCDAAPEPAEGVGGALELARPDDLEAIASIYERCGFETRTAERWRDVFEDGRHLLGVARDGDAILGFVELETHWPERPWVSFVGVDPDQREHGLGSALVAWALADRFAAGASCAMLVLSPSNRSAVRAYEKVGFRLYRTLDVLERVL